VDADVLVRDYLGRLEAASAVLPGDRRDELAAEVREHIDGALAESGRSDEVTVRNILDRLGSPEEIVAAEVGLVGLPGGTPVAPAPTRTEPRWGAIEVAAVALLCLAWPAMFLPFGQILWLGLGAIGLALVWASGVWTIRRKLVTTVGVTALYLLFLLLTTPVSVQCTTGNPPQPCPPGGPTPVISGS
jgi:HAAS